MCSVSCSRLLCLSPFPSWSPSSSICSNFVPRALIGGSSASECSAWPASQHLSRPAKPVAETFSKKRFLATAEVPNIATASDDSSPAFSHGHGRVAVLWFKKDLRLDDHPGLRAGAEYDTLVPVYILDTSLLLCWSDMQMKTLVDALKNLKLALQNLGSDLIVRKGRTEDELRLLVREVQADVVITEEEVEHTWLELATTISNNLESCMLDGKALKLQFWNAPLYDIQRLPTSYNEFERLRCPVKTPLEAPTSLPPMPQVLDKGELPSLSAINEYVVSGGDSWLQKMKSIQDIGAEALLGLEEKNKGVNLSKTQSPSGILSGFYTWRERYILASSYEAYEKRKEELALQLKEKDMLDTRMSGAYVSLDSLNGYLRFLEPTWRNDWKKLYEDVVEAERKGDRGTSFRALFGGALSLGTISARRIYHEAFEYEKARNGGWASPFGFSTFTAAAAVQEIKSIDWYRMLAAVSKEESKKRGWHVRTWCWRGYFVQYVTLGLRGSPIVLVHGFGAFWEHYRDNITGLAEENRVWALTLIGFGRSEKPNAAYTELLWSELIRDFIIEVVGEPAILIGNSIGGYMVSVVAGLWPQIIKSLVLLNTAGSVVPNHRSFRYVMPREKTAVTRAAAQALLFYLKRVSRQLLKKCYPVNMQRADDWLAGEVLRAAHDPGAASVMECVFCLRQPLPVNWYLDRYKNKVLVIQGNKDPLSDQVKRGELLKLHCSNTIVELLNAGHCPHDEVPDEVNKLIMNWIQQINASQGHAPLETCQAV